MRVLVDNTHVIGRGIGRLGETADPEHLGGLQERAEVPLVDVYLAVVDKLDQCLQVVEHDILQHDHGVLARRTLRGTNENRKTGTDLKSALRNKSPSSLVVLSRAQNRMLHHVTSEPVRCFRMFGEPNYYTVVRTDRVIERPTIT